MSLFDGTHIEVVVTATKEKVVIPAHWMDNPELARPFELPPSARAKAVDEPPAENPDDPEGTPPEDPDEPVDDPVDEPTTTDTTQTPAAAPAAGKNPGRRG